MPTAFMAFRPDPPAAILKICLQIRGRAKSTY
jgi:hypothetical protein